MTDKKNKKPKSLAGIWVKECDDKDNPAEKQRFLTISLDVEELLAALKDYEGKYFACVAWKNKQKNEDKHPDYRMYKSKPMA